MSARTIELRIRGTEIRQTYTLHKTPGAAAADAPRGQTCVVISFENRDEALLNAGAQREYYDWVPAGQPLPVHSEIVGAVRSGRFRRAVRDDVDEETGEVLSRAEQWRRAVAR